MKAIDLNFATTPLRNNSPYYLGYGLGTLLLAAFTAYNGWAFFAYSQSRAELESDHAAKKVRLEALYRDAARLQDLIKQKNIEVLNSKATFTNGLLERRRFSWTDLLNSLEEAQPYQIRLLSLIPRIQEKGILIEARAVAKDMKAFWNFQQNLQNHPKFRRVYPTGYLRNNEAGEYIFGISFNYFPNGAPVDVQGLTPELAGIIQAPGDSEGSERNLPELQDDGAAEAPTPKSKGRRDSSGKTVPLTGAPRPGTTVPPPPPPASPLAQVPPGAPPRVGNPPGAGGAVDPGSAGRVQADSLAGRGASAQPAIVDINTTVAGAPAPPPGGPPPAADGDPGNQVRKPRPWIGRGSPPGSGGKRPPIKKTPLAPTVPIPGMPQPQPEDDGKKGGGGGDD